MNRNEVKRSSDNSSHVRKSKPSTKVATTFTKSATSTPKTSSTAASAVVSSVASHETTAVEAEQQQHHHHEQHPPDEVIVLDLSLFDEYGNRTVPVYRRSVRLKFDNAKELQQQSSQWRGGELLPDETLDYHATVPLLRLKNCSEQVAAAWRSRILDDDVITTVMNKLQASHPDMLFVNPCITQCVLFAKVKHVPLFLDPLAASRYANVFFVLNDGHRSRTTSCGSSSGTRHHHHHTPSHHWSLLMYDKASRRLYHYDSMRNANYKVAYELSQKVCEYLNAWAVTDVRCEQQTNATDCGYFVIDNMLKLIFLLRNAKHTPPSQIARLPPLIAKTKNYVANLYERVKPTTTLKTDK